jgi:hypothetical protein
MAKPNKIWGSLAVAVAGVFCALVAGAGEVPSPASAADRYRLEAQPVLESDARAMRERDEAWLRLSPAEREQALARVRESADQESAEMISAAAQAEEASPAADACPLRGVRYPDREPAVPSPFHARNFRVLDFWGGLVKGECVGVYAGYDPADPLLGKLVVYRHPDEPSRFEVYPTPKPTGPVEILSQANGALVLSSVRGAFDRDRRTPDPDGSTFEIVEAPGGETFVFDLRTLRYR